MFGIGVTEFLILVGLCTGGLATVAVLGCVIYAAARAGSGGVKSRHDRPA